MLLARLGPCAGFMTAYASAAYRRAFFDEDVFKQDLAPDGCRHHDDIWFAGHLWLRQVRHEQAVRHEVGVWCALHDMSMLYCMPGRWACVLCMNADTTTASGLPATCGYVRCGMSRLCGTDGGVHTYTVIV